MVTWGMVSAAMVFMHGNGLFYGLRFALGDAEAAFFPGAALYFTYCGSRSGSGRRPWAVSISACALRS